MTIELRDIKLGWRNMLSIAPGVLIGILLFIVRSGNDATRWNMIRFQDHLPSMRMWALLVAILTVLFTTTIYILFFKVRHKFSSLEKRFDGEDHDVENTQTNLTNNKSTRSGILGMFIYMGLMFRIHAQNVDLLIYMIHHDNLLNMTIGILLISCFTALPTFIMPYFVVGIYYKVSVLEKRLGITSINRRDMRLMSYGNTLTNRMPTKCIGMFFLGLSLMLVPINSVRLISFIPVAFAQMAKISTIKAIIVASALNTALIHVIGLGIILCILYKLLITTKEIEAKLSKGCQ